MWSQRVVVRDRGHETWKKGKPLIGCIIVLAATGSGWLLDAADSSEKLYWIHWEPSQRKKGRSTYRVPPFQLVGVFPKRC